MGFGFPSPDFHSSPHFIRIFSSLFLYVPSMLLCAQHPIGSRSVVPGEKTKWGEHHKVSDLLRWLLCGFTAAFPACRMIVHLWEWGVCTCSFSISELSLIFPIDCLCESAARFSVLHMTAGWNNGTSTLLLKPALNTKMAVKYLVCHFTTV